MAVDDDDDDDDLGGKKKFFTRRVIILIAAAVLFVLIVGAVLAYFLGVYDKIAAQFSDEAQIRESTVESLTEGIGHFMSLDEITVSLNSESGRSRFLKMKLVLELEQVEDEPIVAQIMPRILDNFQVYLREVRIVELQGSQGIYRLREELLRRVNSAISPLKIKDVLFDALTLQ